MEWSRPTRAMYRRRVWRPGSRRRAGATARHSAGRCSPFAAISCWWPTRSSGRRSASRAGPRTSCRTRYCAPIGDSRNSAARPAPSGGTGCGRSWSAAWPITGGGTREPPGGGRAARSRSSRGSSRGPDLGIRRPAANSPGSSARERCLAAMDRLPDHYREVVIWHHRERLPFEEIGRRRGISAEATRKLWTRALGRLRQELGSEYGSP